MSLVNNSGMCGSEVRPPVGADLQWLQGTKKGKRQETKTGIQDRERRDGTKTGNEKRKRKQGTNTGNQDREPNQKTKTKNQNWELRQGAKTKIGEKRIRKEKKITRFPLFFALKNEKKISGMPKQFTRFPTFLVTAVNACSKMASFFMGSRGRCERVFNGAGTVWAVTVEITHVLRNSCLRLVLHFPWLTCI